MKVVLWEIRSLGKPELCAYPLAEPSWTPTDKAYQRCHPMQWNEGKQWAAISWTSSHTAADYKHTCRISGLNNKLYFLWYLKGMLMLWEPIQNAHSYLRCWNESDPFLGYMSTHGLLVWESFQVDRPNSWTSLGDWGTIYRPGLRDLKFSWLRPNCN